MAGGHQPIANEDRTCFVVLNGEIYTTKTSPDSAGNGHRFRTRSDTEVEVHLWRSTVPAWSASTASSPTLYGTGPPSRSSSLATGSGCRSTWSAPAPG
ncbi:MAG: hypothetical protein M5U14_13785 [Acidimicrobiia bacterium]|nr:hypothetical protein [Acidimicrobiia bacterium]